MPNRATKTVLRILLAAAAAVAAAGPAPAAEPGIDIAAPRVAISTVDGVSIGFHPPHLVVEQEDYVRWVWTGAAHTTTSGDECIADGLWSAPLNSSVQSFTRFFPDDPATFPFFCNPHCGLGMKGEVVVTAPIALQADAPPPGTIVNLRWSGGNGIYRIFRSTSPLFTAGTTTQLTGPLGTTALGFDDQTGSPPVGGAVFYLVMNLY